ncbi:MAG: hypothetical protein MUF49_16815 [Oculatellaceae cyanobacterium Prado106]|jgi:hypothetical protein|nr:hypothetical protein [Oculatellaceae cyanobacterium Prado106]
MARLLSQPIDQQISLSGTWAHFKLIQQGFENAPGTKLSYYTGKIEILIPGEDHDFFSV